jgi:HSP20 family protein
MAWPDFNHLFAGFEFADFDAAPAVELREQPQEYVLRAELPGLTEKDITLTVKHDTLTLSARREARAPEGYSTQRRERRAFNYERTFALPRDVDADKVTASLKDGVLTVTVAKAEAAKPRRIEVRAA